MTELKRNSFLAPPSLGGKLAIANLNCWVIIFLIAHSEALPRFLPEPFSSLIVGLICFLGFPLIFCLPVYGGSYMPVGGILVGVIVLVMNSFLWGYGLAWCLGRVKRICHHWRTYKPLRQLPRRLPPLDQE